jgi:serine/threonine-protein kinase
MRHALPASIAGALTIAFTAGAARADDTSDTALAAELFTEGRQLMAAGDYAAACPKLAESQSLSPAADTAFDLGVCYQKASQAAFKVAHDLARSSEEGAAVAPMPALTETVPPSTGQTQRVVGLTVGGAGLAGLVVGVIVGLDAKSKYDDATSSCGSNLCASPSGYAEVKSAQNLATAADVSLIVGAAALGAGAIVFFTAPRPKASPAPTLGLGPASQGAGLAVDGRF